MPKSAEDHVDARSVFQILIRENNDTLLASLRSGVRDQHFRTMSKSAQAFDEQTLERLNDRFAAIHTPMQRAVKKSVPTTRPER